MRRPRRRSVCSRACWSRTFPRRRPRREPVCLPGDIIVAVGGQPVTTLGEVQVASVNRAENRTVTFQVDSRQEAAQRHDHVGRRQRRRRHRELVA